MLHTILFINKDGLNLYVLGLNEQGSFCVKAGFVCTGAEALTISRQDICEFVQLGSV